MNPATVAGAAITSDALSKISDYVEANAAEAKFDLGSIQEDGDGYSLEDNLSVGRSAFTGGDDALIMLLSDGRTGFQLLPCALQQSRVVGHPQPVGDDGRS